MPHPPRIARPERRSRPPFPGGNALGSAQRGRILCAFYATHIERPPTANLAQTLYGAASLLGAQRLGVAECAAGAEEQQPSLLRGRGSNPGILRMSPDVAPLSVPRFWAPPAGPSRTGPLCQLATAGDNRDSARANDRMGERAFLHPLRSHRCRNPFYSRYVFSQTSSQHPDKNPPLHRPDSALGCLYYPDKARLHFLWPPPLARNSGTRALSTRDGPAKAAAGTWSKRGGLPSFEVSRLSDLGGQ